jgi:hypothetical protein
MLRTDLSDSTSPRQSGLLDMLAWALADDSHPKAWWAGKLGMDVDELDELMLGENDRLVRARMLRALGEATGSREVSRAIRARVMEIVAGKPKGGVLAQLAITIKRLPMWIVAEWISRTSLVKRTPNGLEVVEPEADSDGWDELPDAGELKAALAEAKALLMKMDGQGG